MGAYSAGDFILNQEYIIYAPEDLEENFIQKIDRGKNIAKDKKIVITGLARNCENSLKNNLNHIRELVSGFKSSEIVVYENNSTDRTRNILKNIGVKIIGSDDNTEVQDGFELKRIQKMSKYRNECLNFIKNNFKDFDYILVFDFDINNFIADGIFNSIGYEEEINFDGIGSVSIKTEMKNNKIYCHHYDAWAMKMFSWYEEFSEESRKEKFKWFNSWIPPLGGYPIKVKSCFGGLMLYKINSILSGKYDSNLSDKRGNIFCVEHSALHESMELNGFDNIYMNPSQQCIY